MYVNSNCKMYLHSKNLFGMNKVCIYLYYLPVRVAFRLPLGPFKIICVYFWGKYRQDTYKM